MEGRFSRRLWFLFSLFVVYATTIPFHFTTDRAFVVQKLSQISLNPLISPDTGRRVSMSDVAQNVLLFVPFGALGLLAGCPTTRRAVRRVLFVTALAAALSVSVEGFQLFTLDRVSSLGDVAADTLGALIGALGAWLAQGASTRALRRAVAAGLIDSERFYSLMVAAILVCAAQWEPFDATIDVGGVMAKLHTLHRDIWQFTVVSDEGVALVQFALFAMATCAWLEARGTRRAVILAAGIGVVAAFGLEASQIAIASRMPGLEDAIVRGAGVVIGCLFWTVRRHVRAPSWWLTGLVMATAVGAAVQMWSPFEVSPAFHPVQWVPFLNYSNQTSIEIVSHVIELLLIYFPVGFCFAWVMSPKRAVVTAVIVALLVAASIEYGQGWVVGRYPDITNVGFSVVGTWIGAWAGGQGASVFRETVARLRLSPRRPTNYNESFS